MSSCVIAYCSVWDGNNVTERQRCERGLERERGRERGRERERERWIWVERRRLQQ